MELVYSESYATRGLAAKREYEIKQWSRAKKQALRDGEMAGPKPSEKIDL